MRRVTSPAPSRMRMCLETAFSEMSKGAASSVTRFWWRSARCSCASMPRRTGCDRATKARSRALSEDSTIRLNISNLLEQCKPGPNNYDPGPELLAVALDAPLQPAQQDVDRCADDADGDHAAHHDRGAD